MLEEKKAATWSPKETRMKFAEWIQRQGGRPGEIGAFALAVAGDEDFPIEGTEVDMTRFCDDKFGAEAVRVLHVALAEFRRLVSVLPPILPRESAAKTHAEATKTCFAPNRPAQALWADHPVLRSLPMKPPGRA